MWSVMLVWLEDGFIWKKVPKEDQGAIEFCRSLLLWQMICQSNFFCRELEFSRQTFEVSCLCSSLCASLRVDAILTPFWVEQKGAYLEEWHKRNRLF